MQQHGQYVVPSIVHTTLDATPGQLVFGRDMLLPIQIKSDWAGIRQRKQDIINANNRKENAKRIEHKYRVGEKVLLENQDLFPNCPPQEILTNEVIRIKIRSVLRFFFSGF